MISVNNSVSNSNQYTIGAYGICVVNGEAFDAGVASIISPWTESFDDRWFYHTYWTCMSTVVASTNSIVTGLHSIVIDSQAMRKVENGDVVVAVFENASSDTSLFLDNFRMLVKLP